MYKGGRGARAQGRGAPAQVAKRVRVRCAGAWRICGTCGSPCHAVIKLVYQRARAVAGGLGLDAAVHRA